MRNHCVFYKWEKATLPNSLYIFILSFFIVLWVFHWWGRKVDYDGSPLWRREEGGFLLHWLYIGVCTWVCNMCLICKHWHSMENGRMPWFLAYALRVCTWAIIVCVGIWEKCWVHQYYKIGFFYIKKMFKQRTCVSHNTFKFICEGLGHYLKIHVWERQFQLRVKLHCH